MSKPSPALPEVVSPEHWHAAFEAMLVKEKELTHAHDALAAQRRRMPMMAIEKTYTFEGPEAPKTLLDLFQGRSQLLLYHFMFAPGVHGWPSAGCPGCSMYMDNLGQFVVPHLNARDTSLAVVSLAPLENIRAYQRRMGWTHPWLSSAHNTFNADLGITTSEGERHGISVFVRDGEKIYRNNFSSQRGLEPLGSVWRLLDLTPFGRQENWEDSPAGRPQSEPYQWWRRHDEY
jgi:predicted dithiol-disulfide oxidoreductase (DUF899 family)